MYVCLYITYMQYVLMCMYDSFSYCFGENCNLFMFEWKVVFEKV